MIFLLTKEYWIVLYISEESSTYTRSKLRIFPQHAFNKTPTA